MIRQEVLSICKDSLIWWVNNWGWTFDPREENKSLPFVLFPKQEEFLLWLAEREHTQTDGLVEKSRDMGATWLCCAYALHGWLFREGYAVGFGSRKLELVDRLGDPGCIFEKIRFLLYGLPAWMLPEGFKRSDHDNQARIINPANGSTITGEGGDNIGRGGRSSIFFVDEAAYLEHPQLVERALSQTTRVRIDVSTPHGPGNPFATKRHSGRVAVYTLHWTSDPRKDAAWRAEQGRRFDPVTVAQEIEIDYTASVEGITIPAAWVRAAVGLELPASSSIEGGYDVAEEGKDLNVVIARAGPVVLPPVSWSHCNTTESAWRARDEAIKFGVARLRYDSGGPGMGIKGTWNTSETPLPFEAVPVNFGDSPTETYWPDKRTSKEKFVNLRAEMWWLLRCRFERTFEYVTKGIQHPPEDLISIPDHPQLIAELSLPLHTTTDRGKIKLESKDAMRARGVKSPDFGDALCLCFLNLGKWTFNLFV